MEGALASADRVLGLAIGAQRKFGTSSKGQVGRHRPGASRGRSPRVGADRLGQDRWLRACDRAHPAGRRRNLRPRRGAARADRRADAGAGVPGDARAWLALRADGRTPRLLRGRHGHARRTPGAGTRRAYRRGHARPPDRPHPARLARHGQPPRRGARRGRRDARPRLPRGSRVHAGRGAAESADAHVLGHRARR
jgi:hypothetical protein